MFLSQYFLPTLKENPLEANIISHQLMIRAGMIRQTASGIYSWLPLGVKVLQKVESIIRKEMIKSGANEILMPTIQPAELWHESGRYDAYGKEMLRIKDRHDRDLLYGPTHEEVVTDIFRKNIKSYKDLPMNLFQIHWKFRDEIRPRFGLMRGREFLMKDSYSFDIDEESAKKTYYKIYQTYFNIFKKLGLNAIALKADTGAIGGDLSHEFHILAKTGESAIYYDKKLDQILESQNYDLDQIKDIYAMADDMHDPDKCNIDKKDLIVKRGIEVGHIFNFNTKYSKAMNAKLLGQDGKEFYPNMGSYGIGVSRVIAAAIEANHDDNGIIWPEEISPFDYIIINLKPEDKKCSELTINLKEKLEKKGYEILIDDTNNSMGQKFSNADLIGISKQIIIGPRLAKDNKIEFKDRKSKDKKTLDYDFFMN